MNLIKCKQQVKSVILRKPIKKVLKVVAEKAIQKSGLKYHKHIVNTDNVLTRVQKN